MSKAVEGIDPVLSQAIIRTIREPLLVLDEDLRVLVANPAFYEMFHAKAKFVENTVFFKLGNGQWDIPQLRKLLEKIIPEKKMFDGYEVDHLFPEIGRRIMTLNAREIQYDNGKKKILVTIQDRTESRVLMQQKDILLKEMRHRIANSLQLIASILILKADSIQSIESKAHLQDAHDRIMSIATVQKNLEPTGDGTEVDVRDYLEILCTSLAKSMIGGRKLITITVTGSEGTATADDVIGIGLITTELVINSLKHAFPKGVGAIKVDYDATKSGWFLRISDDGVGMVGMPPIHPGLGTSILGSLSTQLNAQVTRESSSKGTTVTITHSTKK